MGRGDLMTNYLVLAAVLVGMVLTIVLGRLLCWSWCLTQIRLCAGQEVKMTVEASNALRRLEEGLDTHKKDGDNTEDENDDANKEDEDVKVHSQVKGHLALQNIKLYAYIQRNMRKGFPHRKNDWEQEKIIV